MIDLLRSLGAEVEGEGTSTAARHVPRHRARRSPTRRSSAGCADRCCCSGSLLGRTGRAALAPPGGDFPARRTITTHLRALRAMGARVIEDAGGHLLEAPDGLTGASMYLLEASVTGTETALLGGGAGARASPRSGMRPASRTSPSSASFSRRWAPRARASARPTIRIERAGALRGASAHAARRLHRGRVVGASSAR